MLIGLTDPMSERWILEAYVDWLKRDGPDVDVALLSVSLKNNRMLAQCDALVLSGGGDVHPMLYGRADTIASCKDVDERRDRFELELVEQARTRRLPILGICRGSQLLNVAFGGTLIPDIETAGFRGHQNGEAEQRFHPVEVTPGSYLASTVATLKGTVNTYHHQAIEKPGLGLKISARAHDGIAECVELERVNGSPFLLGVQWHPERLKERSTPFTDALLNKFMAEVRG